MESLNDSIVKKILEHFKEGNKDLTFLEFGRITLDVNKRFQMEIKQILSKQQSAVKR